MKSNISKKGSRLSKEVSYEVSKSKEMYIRSLDLPNMEIKIGLIFKMQEEARKGIKQEKGSQGYELQLINLTSINIDTTL